MEFKLLIKQYIIQLVMVIALITHRVDPFPLYKLSLTDSHVLPRRRIIYIWIYIYNYSWIQVHRAPLYLKLKDNKKLCKF